MLAQTQLESFPNIEKQSETVVTGLATLPPASPPLDCKKAVKSLDAIKIMWINREMQ